jgi:hypothetical protein
MVISRDGSGGEGETMMKRLGALVLLAALGGCVSSQPGSFMSHVGPMGASRAPVGGCSHGACMAQAAPGLMGPMGEPIPLQGRMPGTAVAGGSSAAEAAARRTFTQNMPPDLVAQVLYEQEANRGGGILQAGLPPGAGPGPVTALPYAVPPVRSGVPGAVAAVGALGGPPSPFPPMRTSVRFTAPNGMRVSWYAQSASGKAAFSSKVIQVPGRYNFPQANFYRLKLTDIPGFPGVELYPTLEVVPANGKTATFLAHSSVPLSLTRDDFEQVIAGNYLVKVIYLPYPQFQELAVAAPGVVVSTNLEPGADPIKEALQRGSILLVIRMGNIDLEAPGTPPIDAPSPYQKTPPPGFGGMPPVMPSPLSPFPTAGGPNPGMFPGMPGPGPMVPYGMMRGQPGMQLPPGVPPPPPGMLPPAGAFPRGMPTSLPGTAPRAPSSSSSPPRLGTASVQAASYNPPEEKEPEKKSSWLPSFLGGK